MKTTIKTTVILFLAFISTSAFAENHLVKMKSISYEPKTIELKVGDTVQWENVAYTPHSATADDASILDTGLIAPKKKSKAISFSKVGTYSYHCSVHGKTMNGEVNVTK